MVRGGQRAGLVIAGLALFALGAFGLARLFGETADVLVEASDAAESRESQVGNVGLDGPRSKRLEEVSSSRQASGPLSGRQATARTRLEDRNHANHRELRLRFFLAPDQPLEQGQVDLYYWALNDSQLTWASTRVTLDGSNVAQASLYRWTASGPQAIVRARYGESRPGRSKQFWRLERTISGSVEGEPESPIDFVLQKEEQQLLCKGSVLDETGQPVAGSTVSWGVREREWRGPGRSGNINVGVAVPTTARSDPLSAAASASSLVPAADGSFEIWMTRGSQRTYFFLTAGAPGFLPVEGLRVQTGATDVHIVLKRASSLEGSLLVPKNVDLTSLRIALFPEVQVLDGADRPDRKGDLPAECQPYLEKDRVLFRLGALAAGRYSLQVGYLSPHQTLIRVPGIEIHAGQNSRDLRVQNLNLMALIKSILIRVRSVQGHALLSAGIRYSVPNPVVGQVKGYARVDPYGRAYLTIPSQGVELRVSSPGLETLRVPGVREDQDLVLVADTRPRVEVQIRESLPKDVVRRIRLELERVTTPTVKSQGPTPNGARTIKRTERITSRNYSLKGRFYFRRIDPGSYRVRLLVRSGTQPKSLPVQGNPIFRVLRGRKKQVLTVSIDRLRLAEILDESRQGKIPARSAGKQAGR